MISLKNTNSSDMERWNVHMVLGPQKYSTTMAHLKTVYLKGKGI